MSPEAEAAINNLRAACHCLYLEVHASIADDVKSKAEAVIAELELAQSAQAGKPADSAKDLSQQQHGQFDAPRMTFTD